MSVTTETPIATSTANGATTVFPHAFTVLAVGDLKVTKTTSGVVTTATYGVDYTIQGLGTSSGSVTFTSAPANGVIVTRYRDTAIARLTDYQNNGDLPAATLNADLDRPLLLLQEIYNGGKGTPTSIRVPSGELANALPAAASRANRVLAFDSTGQPIAIVGVDSGSAAALSLDLASSAVSKGAALVALNAAAPYAAGTVGSNLHQIVYATDLGVLAAGDFNTTTLTGSDDTAALQAGLDLAGSRTVPPTMTFFGYLVNAPQGTFKLAPGKNYKITAALKRPPGVLFDLNGSTLWQRTAGQDCVQSIALGQGYPFYGTWWGGTINGCLQGVGAATSTGRGLFLEVANCVRHANLVIQGFKYGRTHWEVQYSTFENVHCMFNVVGAYKTARPSDTTLATLDNYETNCLNSYNTRYGSWSQCESALEALRADYSRNGVADLVVGGQLLGQLRTFTVVSGGSGYAASATLPCTITDASGLYAQAFAETNASGVVTAVYSVDAGKGYVSPTVTVTGAPTVAAVVTSTPVSDSDIGDWAGASTVSRGGNHWNYKAEHTTADRPASGYSIWIGDNTQRRNRFSRMYVPRQHTAGYSAKRDYYRWMFNSGFDTRIDDISESSGIPSDLVNPAVPGDYSVIRSVVAQGVIVRWGLFNDAAKIMRYGIDNVGGATYGNFVSHDAVGPTGEKLAGAYLAESSFGSAAVYRALVTADAFDRLQIGMDGTVNVGVGTAVPTARLRLGTAIVSADRGDTSQTLVVGTDAQTQRWATALTVNRTITLSTAGAQNGDGWRIVRTGLGAFTLDFGGLKTLPAGTAAWACAQYDGSAWRLTGYGVL